MKLIAFVVLAFALLAICVPTFAHHGSAVYDTSKPVVLNNAVVTRFVWANPHSIALFDVKDDKGNVTHGPPKREVPRPSASLAGRKILSSRATQSPVYVFQSKTGNTVGRLNKIVLADGTSLKDSALGDQKSSKSE